MWKRCTAKHWKMHRLRSCIRRQCLLCAMWLPISGWKPMMNIMKGMQRWFITSPWNFWWGVSLAMHWSIWKCSMRWRRFLRSWALITIWWRRQSPTPALATAALADWRPAFWNPFPRFPCRLTAVGFAIITASLSSGLKTAIRSRCRITGWKTATPGALNGMNMPLRSNLAAMCAQWKRATANIALCRKIISL